MNQNRKGFGKERPARSTAGHRVWDVGDVDFAGLAPGLFSMAASLVVRHGIRLMRQLPPAPQTVEIGAGLGKMSMLLGLNGAVPTLIDSSSTALNEAAGLFDKAGVPMRICCCDALELPPELMNRFDMSMSLGLNEHFSGALRQKIFDVHYDVLKGGGYALIAVPNRYCISYRVAMAVWKLTGRWSEGLYEQGFSRSELVRRMEQAGFADVRVVSGTYPKSDFNHYILGNLRAALRKIGGRRDGNQPESQPEVSVAQIRQALRRAEAPDDFVSSQSYMLIAMGRRR